MGASTTCRFRARLVARIVDEHVGGFTLLGRGRLTVDARTLRWRPLLLDRVLGRRRTNGAFAIDELLHVALLEHPRFKRHLALIPNADAHGENVFFIAKRAPVHAWLDANRWTIEWEPKSADDDVREREGVAVPPGRRVVAHLTDDGPVSEPIGWGP